MSSIWIVARLLKCWTALLMGKEELLSLTWRVRCWVCVCVCVPSTRHKAPKHPLWPCFPVHTSDIADAISVPAKWSEG